MTGSPARAGERVLDAAVVAPGEHGFSVEAAGDLDAAREAVLARIPTGAPVLANTSVTLAGAGIADAISEGGGWDSARNRMFGTRQLVPAPEAARQRICQHSLPLDDARAVAASGQHSQAGKILAIHQELPGRSHLVLIRQHAGC